MKLEFAKYRTELFDFLLGDNPDENFLQLIDRLYKMGSTKKEIYYLFLDLTREIQLDPRTKDDEGFYDQLADFMDGFTAWGGRFRILPNEPDL